MAAQASSDIAMIPWNSPRRGVVVFGLAALVGLAGCAGKEDAANLACPQVGIVRDAAEISQFAPGRSPSAANVTSRARLADFTGGCEYDDDKVTVNFRLQLIARRGPALQSNNADYRYFVAVVKPDRTPWKKEEFTTSVQFPAGISEAGSEEELEQELPIPGRIDASGYQILLGFQLSPEQLEYNRNKSLERPVVQGK